jgi:hypothetical protein
VTEQLANDLGYLSDMPILYLILAVVGVPLTVIE